MSVRWSGGAPSSSSGARYSTVPVTWSLVTCPSVRATPKSPSSGSPSEVDHLEHPHDVGVVELGQHHGLSAQPRQVVGPATGPEPLERHGAGHGAPRWCARPGGTPTGPGGRSRWGYWLPPAVWMLVFTVMMSLAISSSRWCAVLRAVRVSGHSL